MTQQAYFAMRHLGTLGGYLVGISGSRSTKEGTTKTLAASRAVQLEIGPSHLATGRSPSQVQYLLKYSIPERIVSKSVEWLASQAAARHSPSGSPHALAANIKRATIRIKIRTLTEPLARPARNHHLASGQSAGHAAGMLLCCGRSYRMTPLP